MYGNIKFKVNYGASPDKCELYLRKIEVKFRGWRHVYVNKQLYLLVYF